jgi:hypothetical protein
MESTCPYCREPLSAANVQECPTCHLPHHADCWEENHGCTVFGCASAPGDEPRLAVSTADTGTATQEPHGSFVPPYPAPAPPMPPMPLPGGVTLPFPADPIVNWMPAAVLFGISAVLEMVKAFLVRDRSEMYYIVAVLAIAAYIIRTTAWALMHMRLCSALPAPFRPTIPAAAAEALGVPYYNFYWAFRVALTAWMDLSTGVEKWCNAAKVPANRDTLQMLGYAMTAVFVCDIFLHFPLLGFIASVVVGAPIVAVPLGLLGAMAFVGYYNTVIGLMSRANAIMPANSIPSEAAVPKG